MSEFKGETVMKIVLRALVFLGLMSAVLAEESHRLTISPLASGQDLVGSFSTYRIEPSGEISDRDDWILRRNDRLIAYEREKVSDVWEKNGVGEIVYLQVYHDFKTYIEYYPADFRLLEESEPEWQQLGALFDLDTLKTMAETNRYRISNQEVVVQTANLQGLETTVHWLVALELPLRIEYQRQGYRKVMELRSLYGSEDSPWPQWRQSDYFGMDFVDMGDNESHPLVRALNSGQAGDHRH